MNFSIIRQDIESNRLLFNALSHLYVHFIDTNSFEVSDRLVEELDPELITHYQLIEDNYGLGKKINPNSYFAYKLLLEQVPNIIDKVPASLAELQFCFEKLWENRPKEKIVLGLSELYDQLLQLLIAKCAEDFGSEIIVDWIENFPQQIESHFQHRFMMAFCQEANDWTLPPTKLLRACHLFLEWNDKDTIFLNISPLLISYGQKQSSNATTLLAQTIIDNEEIIIPSSLLGGLLMTDLNAHLSTLMELINSPSKQLIAIHAVQPLTLTDSISGHRLLDVLLLYDRSLEISTVSVPHALFLLLLRYKGENDSFVERVFNHLLELSDDKRLSVRRAVLRALRWQGEKYPLLVVQVLNSLIDNLEATHDQLGELNKHPSADDALQKIESINTLFEFLRHYAKRFAVSFTYETFYSALYTASMKNKEAFSQQVLRFLIDDNGQVRLMGNRIIQFLHHYNYPFCFTDNITTLAAIEQYKLLASVIGFAFDLPKTLPLVLPLVESTDARVRDGLIRKLEELSEYHHKQIVAIVEQYAADNSFAEPILARLRTQYEEFNDRLSKKSAIQELNPQLNERNSFLKYHELYNRTLSHNYKQMEENSTGIMALAHKVLLAKGGGWRIKGREERHQLSSIGTSFTLPRSFFLNPIKFELEHQILLNKEWNSATDTLEEWIINL